MNFKPIGNSVLATGLMSLIFLAPTTGLRGASYARTAFSSPGAKVNFSPPNQDAPGSTVGGASRGWGICITEPNDNFIALMPPSNLGLTLNTHPTIWLYVPATSANAVELVFSHEDGTEILRKTVAMPEQPGIVSYTLDESDLPALQVGKDYHWYASILCSDTDRSGNAIVDGWVKRIDDSTLGQKLARAAEETHPALYAEAGIWYETLQTLAHLRRTQPNNSEVTSSWQDLLQSVGLDSLAEVPLQ